MLCNEFDPNPHAMINPEDHIKPIPGFPEICVMVFSNHIAEMCLRRWGGERIAQVKCCVGDMPIYRVIVDGTEVALSTPYVGGPAAATFIEEVWPLGGKYFVFFGAAGVLDRNIPLNNSEIARRGAGRGPLLPLSASGGGSGPGPPPVWMPAGERWRVWACPIPRAKPGLPTPFFGRLRRSLPVEGSRAACPWRWSALPWRRWPQFRGVRFAQFFLHHRQFGRSCVGQRRAGTARSLCGRGMYRRRRGNGRRLTQL